MVIVWMAIGFFGVVWSLKRDGTPILLKDLWWIIGSSVFGIFTVLITITMIYFSNYNKVIYDPNKTKRNKV